MSHRYTDAEIARLDAAYDTVRSNYVLVTEKADFPAPSGGIITLAASCVYEINGTINIGSDRLVLGDSCVIKGQDVTDDVILYIPSVETDTAQAGTTTSITLASGSASAVNDFYNGWTCTITSGTSTGAKAIIKDYDGTTKVATVLVWTVGTPGVTSVYALSPPMIVGAQVSATITNVLLACVSQNAAIFDITDTGNDKSIQIYDCILTGNQTSVYPSLGSVEGVDLLIFRQNLCFHISDGLDVDGIENLYFSQNIYDNLNGTTGVGLDLVGSGTFGYILVNTCRFSGVAGWTALREAGTVTESEFHAVNNNVDGGMTALDGVTVDLYEHAFIGNLGMENTQRKATIYMTADPNTTGTVITGTAASVTGTATENFVITAGVDDVLKIDINNAGAVTLTIPAGTYTATELAHTLREQYEGTAIDGLLHIYDDGTGKLKMDTPLTGVASEIDIQTVTNNCYTIVGLTVAVTNGLASGSTNPTKVIGSTQITHEHLFDSPVDNSLRYLGEAIEDFIVHVSVAVECGSQNKSALFSLRQNGIEVTGSKMLVELRTANIAIAMALTFEVELTHDDLIELYVENASGTETLIISYMQMVIG